MSEKNEQRLLFLDQRNVSETANMSLRVGTAQKHPANPLFIEDRPWEQRFDNLYGNIIYDEAEQLYQCWYSPFIISNRCEPGMTLAERRATKYTGRKDMEMGICYATSADGFTWHKPDLGLVEYDGSKQNNLVWRGPHGAGIFRDDHDIDLNRRYKTIFQGMQTSYSADGLNWSVPQQIDCNSAGDTHNNVIWSAELNRYVAFTRTWTKTDRKIEGMESKINHGWSRQVARMESANFVDWSNTEVVIEGTSWELQPYAMPVFKHAGIYLGLIAIHDQVSDRVWTELAWSADTSSWERIDQGNPLIDCGVNKLDYDYGCVYACLSPVFLENEIRLYYGGSDWLHFDWRTGCLALATLRPDGFAGYQQDNPKEPGKLTTNLIAYNGQNVKLTADVYEGGFINTKIIDRKGSLLAERDIHNSVTDSTVLESSLISAEEIALKITAKSAKIFSFSLCDDQR